MLTELGKRLRMIRIEENELLKDMAIRLNITPAYLSSIENGKRVPTRKFIDKVVDTYDLLTEAVEDLMKAYYLTLEEVSIDLKQKNTKQQELGLVFARKFDELGEDKVRKLLSILKND